jgi:DNA-directed RNA polymerase specialized sigma24 family protein
MCITRRALGRQASIEFDVESRVDERKSRVVELRFFRGLTVEETAAALKVCPDTVMRDWRLAKVWLQREMRGERSPDA